MIEWLQTLTPPTALNSSQLMAYAMLDIMLIVILARLLGGLMVRLGQPRVVGEILAGVLLGPTLLGQPLSEMITPLQVRPILNLISMLGLLLFMFLAGLEYDASKIDGRLRQAGLLAVASVGVPAVLGFPVAFLLNTPEYSSVAGLKLVPLALFVGAALSVTAFPVMAHILMERGELNSPMGSLAVASSGLISVLMFSYIAFAGVAVSTGEVNSVTSFSTLLTNLILMALFIALSWWPIRPLLKIWLERLSTGDSVNGNMMALLFGGLLLYGAIAHLLGFNALVGGFAWGFIQPNDLQLRATIAGRLRDVGMILLLPVFFAMAGFATDLKLLTPATIPAILLFLAAAIGGKFLAALPARSFGMSWRDTISLGALFNTRGLLVLVVGLIGLQIHIITTLTFTIIVVVALATNLMTLPIMNFIEKSRTPGSKI